jgi:hypothetical protein
MKLTFGDILTRWNHIRCKKVEVVLPKFATRLEIASLDMIDNFESQSGIILPHEYKEFCLIFGSGNFGITFFRIECLPYVSTYDGNTVEYTIISSREILDNYKQDCQWSSAEIDLLDSGLIFGSGDNQATSFVFDLRTYSERDLSYDIYGIYRQDLSESTGIIYPLGRSFLDFIENICAGDGANLKCPELLPKIDEDNEEDEEEENIDYMKRRTFCAFGGVGENFEEDE